MGFWRDLLAVPQTPSITAQYAPPVVTDAFTVYTPFTPFQSVSRSEALSVPAVMRCRNLIATTIGTMKLETYSKATKQELPNLPWVNQLSYSAPNNVILSALVDALLFYGVGYLEVTELYADDQRPSRFNFVNNNRVTTQLNKNNTFVEFYSVDGKERPMSGVGSLVTFQSPIDGILNVGGRILRAAIDLEKASAIAAATPMASGVLKNSGADMTEKEVQGLLASWRTARAKNATAYLTSTLDYQTTQFSPKDMMYNEAQQYMATQIARLCNIPAYYISADQNNSMTYSNVQDERRQFVALSLQPYVSALEERFSMDDLSPNTQMIAFDMDSGFLRANPLERLNVIEKMLALDLITVEQAREMEELSPNGNN